MKMKRTVPGFRHSMPEHAVTQTYRKRELFYAIYKKQTRDVHMIASRTWPSVRPGENTLKLSARPLPPLSRGQSSKKNEATPFTGDALTSLHPCFGRFSHLTSPLGQLIL